MTNDRPIACTLTVDERAARRREISAVGCDALTDSRLDAGHAQLRFAAGAGIRERVQAIAAAESRCCAFLDFRVSAEPGAVVLSVAAPDGGEAALAELVGAFSREADR